MFKLKNMDIFQIGHTVYSVSGSRIVPHKKMKAQLFRITYPGGDGELHIETQRDKNNTVWHDVHISLCIAAKPDESTLSALQRAAMDILKLR